MQYKLVVDVTSDERVGVNFPHFHWLDFATELRSGDGIDVGVGVAEDDDYLQA